MLTRLYPPAAPVTALAPWALSSHLPRRLNTAELWRVPGGDVSEDGWAGEGRRGSDPPGVVHWALGRGGERVGDTHTHCHTHAAQDSGDSVGSALLTCEARRRAGSRASLEPHWGNSGDLISAFLGHVPDLLTTSSIFIQHCLSEMLHVPRVRHPALSSGPSVGHAGYWVGLSYEVCGAEGQSTVIQGWCPLCPLSLPTQFLTK